MIQTRAYDNEHGEPVAVIVVTGTHDVSRFANLMNGGVAVVEQYTAGRKLLRLVNRHDGGRSALKLLAAHGGPDFTEPEVEAKPDESIGTVRTAEAPYDCDSPYICADIAVGETYTRVTVPPERRGNDDPRFHHEKWCTPCVVRRGGELVSEVGE